MRRLFLLIIAVFCLPAATHFPAPSGAQIIAGLSLNNFEQGVLGASPSADTEVEPVAATRPVLPVGINVSGFGRAFGMRPGSEFVNGLMGGFLGAGLGGALFGGGFFSAMHGGPGVLGLLGQLFLAYNIYVWLYRSCAARLVPAGAVLYARLLHGGGAPAAASRPGFFGGGRKGRPIILGKADFRSFEELLHCMQTAWSAQDMNALRTLMTRDMADSYAEQLNELGLRGLRNIVRDVRLLETELCDAWSDGKRDHATVSMNFSMIDATIDTYGRVVEGNQKQLVTVTQYWSFERTSRARWIVSGISQMR